MHAERDHLVKVVFPALRERVVKDRVYLDDRDLRWGLIKPSRPPLTSKELREIDLRWGISEEQAEKDVLYQCLQEIDRCRPFFIGMLGERYGWVPPCYPADTLEQYPWIGEHAGKSVTELEILHGALQNPARRGHALFYLRDPNCLRDIPEALRRSVFAETDPALAARSNDLKARIRSSGYPVLDNYPAHWDPQAYDRPTKTNGRLVGLEEFGRCVQEQLWEAIRTELQLGAEPAAAVADPLAEEADFHERFLESRLRVYVGREAVQELLRRFADGAGVVPCLVSGPSGAGKSAALARFVTTYRQQHPEVFVLPHFVGASPRSTGLRDLLRRLCLSLKNQFALPDDVPEEAARLIVAFRDLLGKVPAGRRVLLAIDAVNQLDEADRAQHLEWLPAKLPADVKVVVSCISDSGRVEPALKAFGRREHVRVEVKPLDDAERRAIIREVPSLSGRTLDERQVGLLLSNPATANPLFLLVALEELRGFGSYEHLNERIAAFPRDGDTVTAVFTQVLERLEEDFDPETARAVLTLLASARRGLSERELQELLATTAGRDDLFPVLRQLRPYLLNRAGLNDFYHRNLSKAVRQRYLDTPQKQRAAHARLADYFQAQNHFLESSQEQRRRVKRSPASPRVANVRKVDELPWQRLQAGQWEVLQSLLTDLPFLEAKTAAGMVFDLADDFSALAAALPDGRDRRRLELLEEVLRRDIHFVDQHHKDYPQGLFQCLWNSCWWYDCPDAAKHYVEGRAPGEGAGLGLCELLEAWRAEKERTTPGFVWLRSLRPPASHLGTPQRMLFRGHNELVKSVAFSPDGRLASGASDHTVRIWDAHSGAELHCLHGHQGAVQSVAFSPDGKLLASGSGDKTVQVWDAHSGALLHRLSGHDLEVESVAFSPDGNRLASGSRDGTIRVWNVVNCEEPLCLRTGKRPVQSEHEWPVHSVAFSPDGKFLASGSDQVWLWDAESGALVRCLRGHESWVESVSFSPDGKLLASGGADKTIRVWDSQSGLELRCLRCREGGLRSLYGLMGVAFSADGRLLASAAWDGTVRVWDAQSGTELHCLHGHGAPTTSVAFSPYGWLASGAFDKTVRIWDVSGEKQTLRLQGHTGEMTGVGFSSKGRRLVSWVGVMETWVWDTAWGLGSPVRFNISRWAGVAELVLLPGGCLAAVLLAVLTALSVTSWDWLGIVCVLWVIALLLFTAPLRWQGTKWYTLVALEIPARSPPASACQLQSRGWETVILPRPEGEPTACFPEPFDLRESASHPSGLIWAGGVGNYLCLFTLEGQPPG
jgi:WD40 repeat protein